MMKFTAGFATAWYIQRHKAQIVKVLRIWIAKLELKQDILKHDNPDLER